MDYWTTGPGAFNLILVQPHTMSHHHAGRKAQEGSNIGWLGVGVGGSGEHSDPCGIPWTMNCA